MVNKITEIQISYNNKVNPKDRVRLTSSRNIYDLVLANWNKKTIDLQEEFKVIFLNRANRLLGVWQMSKGGTSATIVDVKLIFATALKSAAHGIVLIHNHPSDNLVPSLQDIELTNKIVKAGKVLDIQVLDHLIISKRGYYSFADEKKMSLVY